MNFTTDNINNDSDTTMYGQSRSTISNTDGNYTHRKTSILPSKNRKQAPLPIDTNINTQYENLEWNKNNLTVESNIESNNESNVAICFIISILVFILIIIGSNWIFPVTEEKLDISIGTKQEMNEKK